MASKEYTKNFFTKEDDPHGLVKRIILKKYVQSFVPVAYYRKHNYHRNPGFLIIDGFAGEGKYGEEWSSEIEKNGSPVIILMVTMNFYFKQRCTMGEKEEMIWDIQVEDSPDLPSGYIQFETKMFEEASLVFVEKDKNRFQKLFFNIFCVFLHFFQEKTKFDLQRIIVDDKLSGILIRSLDENYPIVCFIFNSSFKNFTERFEGNEEFAWFSFIDPFGYTDTPMNTLKKYFGPNKHVLFNFMSGFVNRFVSRNPEGVSKLFGFEIPSEMEDDEKAEFVKQKVRSCSEEDDSKDSIRACANTFTKYCRNVYPHYDPLLFEMRGQMNVTIYHLIFLSEDKTSFKNMKEAMNRCTQYSGEFRMSDYDIMKKDKILNLNNTQDYNMLAQLIFEHFAGQRVYLEEIENFVTYDTLYLFRKKPLEIMKKEENPRIVDVASDRKRFAGNPLITFCERSVNLI